VASRQFDPGGGGTTTAGFGREEFVRSVVDRYEATGLGVDESVVDYMLSDVVVDESRWYAGLDTGRIDVEVLANALTDALQRAARYSEDQGRLIVSRRSAEVTFRPVIEQEWRCPYGLWWC
jgi:hypothetical protein